MKKPDKDMKDSILRLKEQYIQAHLMGNTPLKTMIRAILSKLGEAVPKV